MPLPAHTLKLSLVAFLFAGLAVRSAPVLGRSNVRNANWLPMIWGLSLGASLAAPEDGRSPPNLAGAADPAKPSTEFNREALDFFEKNIRPVLAERCYEC